MPGFDPKSYLNDDEDAFDPKAYLSEPEQSFEQEKSWAEQNIVDPAVGAYKNLVTAVRDMPSPGTQIPIIGPAIEKATSAMVGALPGTSYAEQQAMAEQKAAQYAKEHPLASAALTMGSSMALPLGAGGRVAAEGAGLAAKAGVAGLNAAERTAAMGAQSYLDALIRGEDATKAGVESATMAGGIEAGLLGLKGAGKMVGPSVFGVKNKLADYYRKNRGAVKAASEEKTKSELDELITGLKSGVEETKEALGEAKMDKKVAERNLINELRQTTIPEDLPQKIIESRKALRGKVSAASGEAFDILQAQDKTIPTSRIKAFVTQKKRDLEVAGKPPFGDEAYGYNLLDEFRGYLDDLPKDMRPEDMKRLVQMLDAISESTFNKAATGTYVSRGERSLGDIRKYIDKELKLIPEYRDKMDEVADATKLSVDLEDFFGDEKKAFSQLRNLAKPENRQARETLERLGKSEKSDYIKQLGEYETAQSALKSPQTLDFYKQGLPEAKALSEAQANLEMAQGLAEPVKGLTPANTQQFIRMAGSDARPNIERQKLIEYLSKTGGKDFRKDIADIAAQQAFEKGFTQGSRNVNLQSMSLGSILGYMSRKLGGGDAADLAKGVGAISGAVTDVMGPKMYQRILDIIDRPDFQLYRGMLTEALRRSPQAFLTTSYLLSQKDPNFARLLQQSQGGEINERAATGQR